MKSDFEIEKKLSADFSQVNALYYEKMFSNNFKFHQYDVLDVNRFLNAKYDINIQSKVFLYSLYIVDQLFINGQYLDLIKFLQISRPSQSDYEDLRKYFTKKIQEEVNKSFYAYVDTVSEEFDASYNKALSTKLTSADERLFIEEKYGLYEDDYENLRDVFYLTSFNKLYSSEIGYILRDIELNAYYSFPKKEILKNVKLTDTILSDLSCIWNLKEMVSNYVNQYKLSEDKERLMRIFLDNPKLVEFLYDDNNTTEVFEFTDLELKFLLKIDKLIEDIDLQNAKKTQQNISAYEFKRIDNYIENYDVLRNSVVLEMVDEYTDDLISIKELLSRCTQFVADAKQKGVTSSSRIKL